MNAFLNLVWVHDLELLLSLIAGIWTLSRLLHAAGKGLKRFFDDYLGMLKVRAANESRIITTLDSLVELQKQAIDTQREAMQQSTDMQEKLMTAIGVHTLRLNNLEDRLRGDSSAASH